MEDLRSILHSLLRYLCYKSCYKVLGLNEKCTQDEVKSAFIELAKKYHPDSLFQEADSEKFQLIENAYRKLQEKFNMELMEKSVSASRSDDNTENLKDVVQREEQDIEHSAPQHRQYLNYEGIGQGTPFQREKQYQKYQVKKAIENVYNHRLAQIPNTEENSLVAKDAKASKKTKTKYGIDRLVEDLIQESMAKGEFSSLKGFGKPLPNQNHNPYIDTVTHKINQVLIDNGFSPQWVMLEKEIRTEISSLKERLQEARRKLGRYPLNSRDDQLWKKLLSELNDDVKHINKKINDYNLIVPLLNKQLVHVNLSNLAEKCLKNHPSRSDSVLETKKVVLENNSKHAQPSFWGLLNSLWKPI